MKKNFVNIVKTLCIVALFLVILAGSAKATDASNLSFKLNATPSQTVVVEGDIVKIGLKLSDINVGDEGLNTFSFRFTYDDNFFEDVTVTQKNNWALTYNNEKDNEEFGKVLGVLLVSGVTEDQDVGEITLKVKSNLTAKKSDIKFTEISTNNGLDIVKDSDKTITVNVKEEAKDENTVKPDENLSTKPIPQTGVKENAVTIIIAIVVTSAIAVVAYVLYRRFI